MLDFDQLKQLVLGAEEDIAKAEGGNKAAGTRVRKAMQDIKDAAQTIRKKVLELRSEGEAEEEAAAPAAPAAPAPPAQTPQA